MKIFESKQRSTTIIYALLVLVLVISAVLLYVLLNDRSRTEARERDIIRITDMQQIKFALNKYYNRHGHYPACLYAKKGCESLEGSFGMLDVPIDPLTNDRFNYAAYGKGSVCTDFHVGISLERTASQALLTGSDAPPRPRESLCTGSESDFSGLSFREGGDPCDTLAGVAQPTDSPNGETCYDLTSASK